MVVAHDACALAKICGKGHDVSVRQAQAGALARLGRNLVHAGEGFIGGFGHACARGQQLVQPAPGGPAWAELVDDGRSHDARGRREVCAVGDGTRIEAKNRFLHGLRVCQFHPPEGMVYEGVEYLGGPERGTPRS